MIKIGQKYRFINFKDYLEHLNGIIVKVIKYDDELDNAYLVEIDDKSLLDNYYIKWYFHNNGICENNWYRWIKKEYLQPLRSDKLKRLLK